MKALKNILFWLSTVCLVLAIVMIAVPTLLGNIEFRAVVSGSMAPDIPVGSLVVIVKTNAEDIKVGDDITFVTAGDKVVTHRVVEINAENEFITWGIANPPEARDAPNKYENILGVVRFNIPYAGIVFSWLATLQGKIIVATIIVAIYIISCMFGLWSKDEKKNKALQAAAPGAPPDNDVENIDAAIQNIVAGDINTGQAQSHNTVLAEDDFFEAIKKLDEQACEIHIEKQPDDLLESMMNELDELVF